MVLHVLQQISAFPGVLDFALRAALSGIFLVSGTGKVWDLPGTRQALSDFGVPDGWTSRGSRYLPGLEISLGLALAFDLTCRPAAGAAALLSLGFVLAIANLLRQGRTPPCHCFGAIQSSPVGKATLIRAVMLMLASLVCCRRETAQLTPDFTASLLAGGAALLTVSAASNFALWNRLRHQHQSVSLRVGQRLPALRLFNQRWLNEILPKGGRSLVIVTSPGCGSCTTVQSQLDRWRRTLAAELSILELQARASAVQDEELGPQTYGFSSNGLEKLVRGTPGAFLVNDQGVLLSPPVTGSEEVEALIRVAVSAR